MFDAALLKSFTVWYFKDWPVWWFLTSWNLQIGVQLPSRIFVVFVRHFRVPSPPNERTVSVRSVVAHGWSKLSFPSCGKWVLEILACYLSEFELRKQVKNLCFAEWENGSEVPQEFNWRIRKTWKHCNLGGVISITEFWSNVLQNDYFHPFYSCSH